MLIPKFTIAVSKGRILDESLELLQQINIQPQDDIHTSRKLIFATTNHQVQLAVLRATDVPTYVAYGAADIGISGKDVLLENSAYNRGWYEVLDLNIAKCKLMVAKLANEQPINETLKIATKFPKVTKQFYAARNEQISIIKLYGSLELAPIMGLSHRIVDNVATGKTLAENNLETVELIHNISARLIINKSSMKIHYSFLQPFIEKFSHLIQEK